jgi:hypothetical protein
VLTGIASGAANGLFGSGGGLLAVPMLESGGFESKEAHATSLAITLPLSVVSAIIYFHSGNINVLQAAEYLPGGIAGVFAGSFIMRKISARALRKIFAAVMIYFGIRMLF